jgi:hypothetical protein
MSKDLKVTTLEFMNADEFCRNAVNEVIAHFSSLARTLPISLISTASSHIQNFECAKVGDSTCGNDYGVCIPCRKACHMVGEFANHKLQEMSKGGFYCGI